MSVYSFTDCQFLCITVINLIYFNSIICHLFSETSLKSLEAPNSPVIPSWKWSSSCWRESLLYTSTQNPSGTVCVGVCVYFCVIFDSVVQCLTFFLCLSSVSALIKQVNKSIDGTADDEEEGVPTEEAIRAGLELLKVKRKQKSNVSSTSSSIYNIC